MPSATTPCTGPAITRQLDLVDRFHELGADIDARRADGRAPVQVAVDGDYCSAPPNCRRPRSRTRGSSPVDCWTGAPAAI